MSETAAIIEALKRDLKRRGLTYRDLAKKVGLSEASVKRVFASKSFTLQRLESMCAAVGTSVSELVRSAGTAQDFGAYSLTLEQEELLASDVATLPVNLREHLPDLIEGRLPDPPINIGDIEF